MRCVAAAAALAGSLLHVHAAALFVRGAHRGLNSRQRQQINLREGALAPVFASAALLGAYCLVKFFPDFNVQTFFDCYFWLVGSIAVVGAFAVPARRVVSSAREQDFRTFCVNGVLVALLYVPGWHALLLPLHLVRRNSILAP